MKFLKVTEVKIKVTGVNVRYQIKGLVPRYLHVKYESNRLNSEKVMINLVNFGQNLTFLKATKVKVKVTGVKVRYQMKGLVPRYLHVKYESNRSNSKNVF